ncbi:amino acid permease [Fictibacillus gelatini]|uniref:amino acid permease n=1 Tax=Fictibacillus gelatini TaxID=225985 RepID=UPI000421B118|nr:amino acid permease [Fictibacillus gelatini]
MPRNQNRDQLQETGSEGLDRSLTNRQIQMMAIGGVIGVGLFYGASVSVKLAGPAVLIDFVICGVLVAIVMRSLGEMTVEYPVAGSFSHYASALLGRRIGFLTAGMWWFYWVATVMSELAAIGKLVQYWYPSFPAWIPGLVALIFFTVSNLLAVRVFGEIEYWFAVLKVLAVLVFMAFGSLIILTGIFNNGEAVGINNLWINDGFMPNGWPGIFAAISLVVQAFSGIETLAVEAGESHDPNAAMQKAFKSVTFRILFFYIGSMLVMLCAFPWNKWIVHDGSPYVLMFSKIGIPLAAGIVNLIIILSALSSCNTGLYGGSRMLFSMSKKGIYSQRFAKLNRNKIPHVAVWATAAMIFIGVAITYLAPDKVYVWITSASAFASLWTWGIILVCELAFRRRMIEQQTEIKYPMPLWPVLPMIGLLLVLISFIAIATSPLTKISMFSGVAWLIVLLVYDQIRTKKQPAFILLDGQNAGR